MPRLKPPRIPLITPAVLYWTVRSLEATKDAITAAAPIPGLSIALDALIGLLKKIKEARANSDALLTLCQEATSLANSMGGLVETIQDGLEQYPVGSPQRLQTQERVCGPRSKLVGRVERLATDLRTICAEADKLSKRRYFAKFVYSTRDSEAITGMKDRMAAACQRFQMEGNVAIEALAEEILNITKAAEEDRILSSIPRADDAHYRSAANTMKARLQKGTREQLFAHLEQWEEEQFSATRAQPVCVLVGHAGTGKSTVASEFSKRLEARGRLGASFFFTRGVQDLNSLRKLFSTIASQLARSQPALRSHIVDAVREHATLQQLEREFEDLIRVPLRKLPLDHAPIFVVVDALDECTEEGPDLVPTMLRLLLSEAALPGSPLRVFLTSRPEPHYIHEVLTTSDVRPHISTISIQAFRNSVDGDIEHLIRVRLAEHEKSHQWFEAHPSVVPRLVELSDGLFVYARTAVDYILGGLYGIQSMQERYDSLNADGPHRRLTALDRLYLTVLTGVLSSEDHSPLAQERLRRMLGYLVTLQDPDGISPATLEKLTSVPTDESVPILNTLRSVIFFERDNVNSKFRILHATFREFLVDHTRAGDAFYVHGVEVHGRLADHCESTLRSFAAEHWPGSTGAALLLQLLTYPLPSQVANDSPHVVYAHTYHDHHRGFAPMVQSRAEGDFQLTGGDSILILQAISSYVCFPRSKEMWYLVRTVCDQLRDSLPHGSQLGDTMHAMSALLQEEFIEAICHIPTQRAAVAILQDVQCLLGRTPHLSLAEPDDMDLAHQLEVLAQLVREYPRPRPPSFPADAYPRRSPSFWIAPADEHPRRSPSPSFWIAPADEHPRRSPSPSFWIAPAEEDSGDS